MGGRTRSFSSFGPVTAQLPHDALELLDATGKTHAALGLGLAACQQGLSVRFVTAAALVHELMEARDERRLLRLQKQLANHRLLIIDELGFVPSPPAPDRLHCLGRAVVLGAEPPVAGHERCAVVAVVAAVVELVMERPEHQERSSPERQRLESCMGDGRPQGVPLHVEEDVERMRGHHQGG